MKVPWNAEGLHGARRGFRGGIPGGEEPNRSGGCGEQDECKRQGDGARADGGGARHRSPFFKSWIALTMRPLKLVAAFRDEDDDVVVRTPSVM